MKRKILTGILLMALVASILVEIGAEVPYYYLTVNTNPSGITTIPGAGWYTEGTWINLTAPSTVNGYQFDHWDLDGVLKFGNSIWVYMNTNHTATANYKHVKVAFIHISATSPHVANGTDFSKVTINATDINGTPVIGAEISVRKNQGEDDEKFFTTIDHGNGTYTTQVNSTIAGPARIWAIDNATGLMADCTVYFAPGPLAKVELTATNPREGYPKNTSEVIVKAEDAFNNLVNSSRCTMDITTDLGTVGSIVDEYGIFRTTIASNDLGIANITATAYDSAYGLTSVAYANVTFPTIYFYAPQDAYTVGTTFTVPVNVYVSDPARALGYYDLVFTYNSSVIRFLNVSDGDPYDEFVIPWWRPGPVCIRISQQNNVSMTSPTGSVDIANLTFKAAGEGYTNIDILIFTLIDTKGAPIHVMPPTPPTYYVKVKKPPMKELCLYIVVMEGPDGTPVASYGKIIGQVNWARLVYGVWNLRSCCNVYIMFCYEVIPHNPRYYNTKNDTDEEALLNTYKAKKPCCLPVLYLNSFWDGGTGESIPTRTPSGIIITSGSSGSTLAHELGHALTDADPPETNEHFWDFDDPNTPGKEHAPRRNVLYPDWVPDQPAGPPTAKYELTPKQCDRIMRCNNPWLKWVKTQMPCDYYKRLQDVVLSGFVPGFPSTAMDVYLIPDGANFSHGNEIAMTTVVTDENGTFPETYIWTVNEVGNYDIWVDYNRNGVADIGEYITYEEVGLYRITSVTHDVAVTGVNPYKTVVGQGYCVRINVTVENQGDIDEDYIILLRAANMSGIKDTGKWYYIGHPYGNSTTITFTWNTTGWSKGNYTISAYAWPVPGETDTTDNTFTDGTVRVAVPGDLNGDNLCDLLDLVKVAGKFGCMRGEVGFEPWYDINDDNIIDILDLVKVAMHFGET